MGDLEMAFEKVNQQVADLIALVQSHRSDTATLDVDQLVKVVKDAADAQVTARLEEAEARRPIYKGELVGPPGWRVRGGAHDRCADAQWQRDRAGRRAV